MNIEIFWGNVKFLCKQKGWTQRELGAKIGSNPRIVENQIAARKMPSLEEVLKFCEVLNVPLNALLKNVADDSVFLTEKATVTNENIALANILTEKDKLAEKLKDIQAILLR